MLMAHDHMKLIYALRSSRCKQLVALEVRLLLSSSSPGNSHVGKCAAWMIWRQQLDLELCPPVKVNTIARVYNSNRNDTLTSSNTLLHRRTVSQVLIQLSDMVFS